jgi:Rieske Fe-S protein
MSDSSLPITRRRFCAGACQVASGVTLATVFSACGGSPTGPSGTGSGGNTTTLPRLNGQFSGSSVRVNTSGTALNDVGGAALVESTAGVFLVSRNSASAFTAIDAVCSHESCTITGADGTTYVCQCHGSRYDRGGRVLQGPARASLRQFTTTFNEGVVTIAL